MGETATTGYKVPFFSEKGGQVSCRYNRGWINNGLTYKNSDMPDSELLDFIDGVANETQLEFPFHAGDVRFCGNSTVLHGRAAHAVVPEEDRKPVLTRIWLDTPDFREFSDEAIVRHDPALGLSGSIA